MGRAINNAKDKYYAHQLSLNKLDEMQNIIQMLKDKIINDENAKSEKNEDDEKCINDDEIFRNTKHEHNNEKDDNDDEESSYSLISGVKFIETPTPMKNGSDD